MQKQVLNTIADSTNAETGLQTPFIFFPPIPLCKVSKMAKKSNPAEGSGQRADGGAVIATSRAGEDKEAVLDEEVQDGHEETEEEAEVQELEGEELDAVENRAAGEAAGQIAEGGTVHGTQPVDLDEDEGGSGVLGVELKHSEKPMERIRIVEAALFLANKPVAPAEVAVLAKCSVKQAKNLLLELQAEYEKRAGALQIDFFQEAARIQVRPEYAESVSGLSREVGLSRKGLKILALIAKKGQLLQSNLKKYFRGEIYEYITELKDQGYLISEKSGNTRMLKPTKRFFEHFQVAGEIEPAAQEGQQKSLGEQPAQ